MRIHWLPRTVSGKWSLGLLGGLIVSYLVFLLLVATGQRGGDTFFSNVALAIPAILAAASGVSAFLAGTVGIIRSRERSVLAFVAVSVGILVLVFVMGELIFPH